MISRPAICLLALSLPASALAQAGAQNQADDLTDFNLLQLTETSAQIESGGTPYLRAVTRSQTAIVLSDCLPVMREAQANRLQEAVAETAQMAEDLIAAKQQLAEAGAALSAAQAQLAEASVTAAAVPELEARIAELEALLAPYLAADAEGAANLALLEKAKALKTAGGDMGRLIDADLIALTRAGLHSYFSLYGDQCSLSLADAEAAGEEPLEREVLGTIFAGMGVSDEISAFLLSLEFQPMNAEGSLHREYVEAINASSDDAVLTLGREARTIARDNLDALGDRIQATVISSPDHIQMSEDKSKVSLKNCP